MRSSTAETPRRSRWCSTTPDVALVTAGNPKRRTGGNLYNRHMLAALWRDGMHVTTVVLRDRRDAAARFRGLSAPLVLVDTIAASLAAPHLARLRARGSEIQGVAGKNAAAGGKRMTTMTYGRQFSMWMLAAGLAAQYSVTLQRGLIGGDGSGLGR